jgi:hypothetical protein
MFLRYQSSSSLNCSNLSSQGKPKFSHFLTHSSQAKAQPSQLEQAVGSIDSTIAQLKRKKSASTEHINLYHNQEVLLGKKQPLTSTNYSNFSNYSNKSATIKEEELVINVSTAHLNSIPNPSVTDRVNLCSPPPPANFSGHLSKSLFSVVVKPQPVRPNVNTTVVSNKPIKSPVPFGLLSKKTASIETAQSSFQNAKLLKKCVSTTNLKQDSMLANELFSSSQCSFTKMGEKKESGASQSQSIGVRKVTPSKSVSFLTKIGQESEEKEIANDFSEYDEDDCENEEYDQDDGYDVDVDGDEADNDEEEDLADDDDDEDDDDSIKNSKKRLNSKHAEQERFDVTVRIEIDYYDFSREKELVYLLF